MSQKILMLFCLLFMTACASELTDKDLLEYVTSDFNQEKMWGKNIKIGYHQGIEVRARFPCSDICPVYTTRIVYYNLSMESCESQDGIIKPVLVPFAISERLEDFCLPPVIAHLKT